MYSQSNIARQNHVTVTVLLYNLHCTCIAVKRIYYMYKFTVRKKFQSTIIICILVPSDESLPCFCRLVPTVSILFCLLMAPSVYEFLRGERDTSTATGTLSIRRRTSGGMSVTEVLPRRRQRRRTQTRTKTSTDVK